MIDFQDACNTILSHLPQKNGEKIALLSASGRILRQSFYAINDFPPYHRVAMDGIAISSLNERKYRRIGLQCAGSPSILLRNKTDCVEVMTGAIVPEGALAVVRYEELDQERNYYILKEGVKPILYQNIHLMGSDAKKGDLIFSENSRLTPAAIALIASLGCTEVLVEKQLRLSILSTGSELICPPFIRSEHQIYSSNLEAIFAALGRKSVRCLRANDNLSIICKTIQEGLDNKDVLIISAGVSLGKKDLVPIALQQMGIKKIIHGVSQKPGKPFWFGMTSKNQLVFGLPGNPIAMMVCLYLYVLPLLNGKQDLPAVLGKKIAIKSNLSHFILVKKFGINVYPVSSSGSGDLVALGNSDGFILANKGEVGEIVRLWLWKNY